MFVSCWLILLTSEGKINPYQVVMPNCDILWVEEMVVKGGVGIGALVGDIPLRIIGAVGS